jgi:hypothetical protein
MEEYAHLERVAEKASKTLAEWCREAMLNSTNGGAADTAVAASSGIARTEGGAGWGSSCAR